MPARNLYPAHTRSIPKHATEFDLERVLYTTSLPRWYCPGDLSKLEIRWLQYFAALHVVTEKIGYRGSVGALAAGEYRANRQTKSRRTAQRALAGLHSKGYLDRHTPRTGRWRQYNADGGGARDPEAMYTFTDRALRVFRGDKGPSKLPADASTSACAERKASEGGELQSGCQQSRLALGYPPSSEPEKPRFGYRVHAWCRREAEKTRKACRRSCKSGAVRWCMRFASVGG